MIGGFVLGAFTFFVFPKDADLTSKLPIVTSHTTLDAEYLEGGPQCFQFTTVVPDKFSSKTRIDCNK